MKSLFYVYLYRLHYLMKIYIRTNIICKIVFTHLLVEALPTLKMKKMVFQLIFNIIVWNIIFLDFIKSKKFKMLYFIVLV